MESKKLYEQYMQQALHLAHSALVQSEVPIGALVVNKQGDIIGTGYNTVEQDSCQLGHAELNAIKQATQTLKDWRLNECTLIVTLEPCLMCFGAILQSRIEMIVYGVDSQQFGFSSKQDNFITPVDCGIKIIPGVRAQECAHILESFFKQHRK